MISPLAYIHPEAIIGENCEIGPFCYIDKGVVIGNDNTLMNSVTVLYGARIGNGNIFFPGAVISAITTRFARMSPSIEAQLQRVEPLSAITIF